MRNHKANLHFSAVTEFIYRIVSFHAMESCKKRAKFIGLVSSRPKMSSCACKHLPIVFRSNAGVFL